jgi:hypothetical protein
VDNGDAQASALVLLRGRALERHDEGVREVGKVLWGGRQKGKSDLNRKLLIGRFGRMEVKLRWRFELQADAEGGAARSSSLNSWERWCGITQLVGLRFMEGHTDVLAESGKR